MEEACRHSICTLAASSRGAVMTLIVVSLARSWKSASRIVRTFKFRSGLLLHQSQKVALSLHPFHVGGDVGT